MDCKAGHNRHKVMSKKLIHIVIKKEKK